MPSSPPSDAPLRFTAFPEPLPRGTATTHRPERVGNAKVGTLRGYLEAVGGGLAREYVSGGARVHVA